jgi:hypothetical protein
MKATIKLKIKGQEIELDQEDAVELRDMLNGLFMTTERYVPYFPLPSYPQQPYCYPYDTYTSGSLGAIWGRD